MRILSLIIAAFCLSVTSALARAGIVWLDTMEMSQAIGPWGSPQRNLSFDRKPLSISGKHFSTGVG